MENSGRLFGQIAAEAGISEQRAKLAVYVRGLASNGSTLISAAKGLRREPSTIKRLCREHLIDFADYRPFARERDKGEIVEPRFTVRL